MARATVSQLCIHIPVAPNSCRARLLVTWQETTTQRRPGSHAAPMQAGIVPDRHVAKVDVTSHGYTPVPACDGVGWLPLQEHLRMAPSTRAGCSLYKSARPHQGFAGVSKPTMTMASALTPEQWRSVVQTASGLGAGAISTALLYPLDLVKVRYQVHAQSRHAYRSLGHAFRSIVAAEGVGALFRGMSPALYGSAISWGLYMVLYQNAKDRYARMADRGLIQGSWQYFFSGIEAGLICVPLTNPIWLVKIRMQVQTNARLQHAATDKDAAAKLARNAPYRGVVGESRLARLSQQGCWQWYSTHALLLNRCVPTDRGGGGRARAVQGRGPSLLPHDERGHQGTAAIVFSQYW